MAVPTILAAGAEFYRGYGVGRTRHAALQLGGNICHGGLVEKAFRPDAARAGLVFGGGTASGRPVKAIQVGGPLAPMCPSRSGDVLLDYEAMPTSGGGRPRRRVVHDDTADMAAAALRV